MENIKVQNDQTVHGITIRTKNSDEMNPKTAKIGKLWESFYKDIFPKLEKGTPIYGVYSNYESDQNGGFNVSACSTLKIEGLTEKNLKNGSYLVFKEEGEMPTVVIKAWEKIWNHFNSGNCEQQRRYQTDFEFYKSLTEVEVYIGIK